MPTLKTKTASRAALFFHNEPQKAEELRSMSLYSRFTNGDKKLRTVTVDEEVLYVVEGDTLLDEDQLAVYAALREKENEVFIMNKQASLAGLGSSSEYTRRSELKLLTQDGKMVRWAPGTVLTYRVVRDTFTSSQRYTNAVNWMREASQAWEDTCDVKFQHLKDLDDDPGVGVGKAIFAVREISPLPGDRAPIASAFFPNDPPARRKVLLYPDLFADDLGFDPVGVMRHELGHVLGFRHEHIDSRAPAACQGEPNYDSTSVTDYDPKSVMHYFCGDRGTRDLLISDLDRRGAQLVYGLPSSNFDYIS